MIEIAVVDDEKECLERMDSYLKKISGHHLNIFLVDDAEHLIEKYKGGTIFDIVFLDIEMESMNGIETAKYISNHYGNTIILFTTSHSQYVKEAFYINAFQYMFKPIEFADFKFELERAIAVLKKRKHTYEFMCNYEKIVLPCSDIIYIETRGRQLLIKTMNHEYSCSGTIKEAHGELSQYGFAYIEQGILVNMKHISRLANAKVIMDNGEEKYISRRRYKIFLSEFNLFSSGGRV